MRIELFVAAALAVAALTPFTACSASDVVVATERSQATDGGPPADTGAPGCATNDDCSPNAFCEKPSCSDALGACSARPLACGEPGPAAPVCGCDHLNYWNDCLRRQSGVASSTPSECTVPVVCDHIPETECGVSGASCAHLYPNPPMGKCPPPDTQPGICWVLPPTCPADPSGPRWTSCKKGPGPGSGGGCLPTCEAIRAGEPSRDQSVCM